MNITCPNCQAVLDISGVLRESRKAQTTAAIRARWDAIPPEERRGPVIPKKVRSAAAKASWARRKAAQHELHPGTVDAVRANVQGWTWPISALSLRRGVLSLKERREA